MGAAASVGRSAAAMSVEVERLRERELNLIEEQDKQYSTEEMKREAYIKQLESEKYELKEQLKTVSKEREEQSEGWKKEKNKTLELMFSELPLSMIGQVPSDLSKRSARLIKNFPMVTIAQCDIAGFSTMSSTLNPKELINIVDHLQALVDEAFSNKDIFIMERTSDGCIAVSGLDESAIIENPTRALSSLSMTDSSYGSELDFLVNETSNSTDDYGGVMAKLKESTEPEQKYAHHYAETLAISALKLLSDSSKINVPIHDNKQLQLRIALHSAPCSGGVVGLQTNTLASHIPHYKLFGAPLRYTSNLCRTGLALQIRVSKTCKELLAKCKGFSFERCPDYMMWETRKPIESYWLLGKDGMITKLPSIDCAIPLSEYEDVEA